MFLANLLSCSSTKILDTAFTRLDDSAGQGRVVEPLWRAGPTVLSRRNSVSLVAKNVMDINVFQHLGKIIKKNLRLNQIKAVFLYKI